LVLATCWAFGSLNETLAQRSLGRCAQTKITNQNRKQHCDRPDPNPAAMTDLPNRECYRCRRQNEADQNKPYGTPPRYRPDPTRARCTQARRVVSRHGENLSPALAASRLHRCERTLFCPTSKMSRARRFLRMKRLGRAQAAARNRGPSKRVGSGGWLGPGAMRTSDIESETEVLPLTDRSLFFAAAGFARGIGAARQLKSEIGIPGCTTPRSSRPPPASSIVCGYCIRWEPPWNVSALPEPPASASPPDPKLLRKRSRAK